MRQCLTQPEMLGLLRGDLEGSNAGEALGHLVFCPRCAESFRALREIRADFDQAWSEFVAVLRGVPGPDPASFSAEHEPRLRFVLEVMIDAVRGVASIGARTFQGLAAALEGYQVTVVPAVTGAGDPRFSPEPAPGTSVRVEARITGPEIGTATVIADSQRNAITVLLTPPSGMTPRELCDRHAPRAILVGAAGLPRRLAPLEAVEGADYLLAEFEHLERADWIVGFELRT